MITREYLKFQFTLLTTETDLETYVRSVRARGPLILSDAFFPGLRKWVAVSRVAVRVVVAAGVMEKLFLLLVSAFHCAGKGEQGEHFLTMPLL